ncbi:MAG TPA: NnrS family protein [Gammaproteobacteria bacterium]
MTTAPPRAWPAWLASPFRPFFLLGPLYGVLLALTWTGLYLGLLPSGWLPDPLPLWHGHEMLFGFAAAMVSGFVLTALPSWAGTQELGARPLALLVALWLAGRLASWGAAWLPAGLVAVIDGSYFLLFALFALRGLGRVPDRRYLWLVPIVTAFYLAACAWHTGRFSADPGLAAWGLRLALFSLLLLFSFVGGLLTPIFTSGAPGAAPFAFSPLLERAAVATLLALALTDLGAGGPAVTGTCALLALAVHAARMARWPRAAALADPLLWAMHLGYAWLLVALALRAAADLAGVVPPLLWLHVFTVGAFGSMKLSLMTRVALRHTGRPLQVHAAMVFAYLGLSGAVLARLLAGIGLAEITLMSLSALAWAACLATFVALHGSYLLQPSLPRLQPAG